MKNRLCEQSFYEILEVSPDATQQDIYVAYQKAKTTYAPNSRALYSMFTQEEAHQLTSLIEEAFTVLSDQSRRHDYDKQLIQVHPEKTKKKEPLPDGFGKTRFSVYKLEQAFEDEIAATTIFDGTFLQKVRLYKNVSLDKISEETRISRTYLRAVESNDYDALPAAVFVRGFIVQFARILGLNEKKVTDSYMITYRNAKQE